jgi:hypothetical protein
VVWTTCPRCLGTGIDPEDQDEECALCLGDGGTLVEVDEDDPANLDDVDVKDED